MSAANRGRGRPQGARRAALAGWMSGRTEFTMREAMHSLGWPMTEASQTIHRAMMSGEVLVTGSVRVPDVKRPVAVYARADAQPGAMALGCVMQLWSR